MTLTSERLHDVLAYDPSTGVFRWKVSPRQNVAAGSIAGAVTARGYRNIKIDTVLHKAHRLAWLYVYGVWPTGEIDHRNERKDDNRIANLREATTEQNTQNRTRAHRDSRSGLLGVSPYRSGRWVARIMREGRDIHLGYFDTAEEAHAAYLAAKAEIHPFWIRAAS